MLAEMRQDQVGRYRRHLVEPGFAELALDVVFGGEAEAAVGLQADVGGLPGCISLASSLDMLACAPQLWPASNSAAAWYRIRLAASTFT
jgi:hypothetical protein